MRVLVSGGRDYRNADRVREVLDSIHASTPIEVLIHGDAKGADSLAAAWARDRSVALSPFPARWDNIDAPGARIKCHPGPKGSRARFYNARAGLQRNIQMLIEGAPTVCVIFPGGAGTAHMRAQALLRDFPILEVED